MFGSKKFETRDWVFLIIILQMGQAFICYISFVNASNASALSYVSFAATLISIILAVLAIGYTYGEAQIQKNESNSVVQQVAKLNDVIGDLEYQSGNMNKLEDISDSLSELTKKLESKLTSTHKEVEKVGSTLSQMMGNGGIFDTHEVKTPLKNIPEAIQPLLSNLNEFDVLVLCTIIKCEGGKPADQIDTVKEYFYEIEGVEELEKNRDIWVPWIQGGCIMSFNIFRSLGIIKRKNGNYYIDAKFQALIIEKLKAFDKDSLFGDSGQVYKHFISKLN